MISPAHMLCFGLGYSASALVPRLLARGFAVSGTSRSAEGAAAITASGPAGLVFDGTGPSPDVSVALRTATHLLISAPPGEDGDPALRHHGEEIASAPHLAWIGYLSTVGVYGNHDGCEVDETTPVNPSHPRSRRRIEAERAWLELGQRTGRRTILFRLAGIYGPRRSAIDSVRAGTARRIIKPGQVFNRIHVADIAQVVEAAIVRGGSHDIYDVADCEPAPPQDVISYAAALLGAPEPPAIPYETAELGPMAASFYVDNRRIAAKRIRHDLGVAHLYPTYREGLRAILAG